LKHGVGGINIDDCRVQCEPDDDIVRPDRTDAQAYNFFRGGEQERINVRNTTRQQPSSEQIQETNARGRFPSNVMHDGSDAVENIFPKTSPSNPSKRTRNTVGMFGMPNDATPEYSDSGTASRYFYTAKTNQAERNAGANNTHPTVKPVELMRYLVRLVTPKAGLVLDPFMGSGSTGMAAREEEFKFIGIEKEEEYYEIAKARIKNVKPQLKLFDI